MLGEFLEDITQTAGLRRGCGTGRRDGNGSCQRKSFIL